MVVCDMAHAQLIDSDGLEWLLDARTRWPSAAAIEAGRAVPAGGRHPATDRGRPSDSRSSKRLKPAWGASHDEHHRTTLEQSITELAAPIGRRGDARGHFGCSPRDRRPLGQQLIGANLLKPEDLERAAQRAGREQPTAGRNAAGTGRHQRRDSCCPTSKPNWACRRRGSARACSTRPRCACCRAISPNNSTPWRCSAFAARWSWRWPTRSISTRSTSSSGHRPTCGRCSPSARPSSG